MKALPTQRATVLGPGTVDHLDPPMGVAFGPLTPSDRYSAYLHANLIGGEYIGDKSVDFGVVVDGRSVQAVSIAIEDWSSALGEVHFTLFFKDGQEYETFFRDHTDFKAYYPEAG